LQQLAMADSLVAGTAARARGTVMLAATAYVLQSCVMPALPRFHDRYPEIQLDLRAVTRLNDPDADGADVFLLIGWLDQSDLIQRLLVRNRFLLVASPAYWAEHGMPKQPSDLRDHTCLLMRNPGNTVLDLWRCTRDGVEEAVTVRGWLLTTYRDAILEAVLAGQGVARFSELTIRKHLQSGRLVPGLTDWDMLDAPPLHLLYRSGHRRSPRVRPVIDFLGELFRDLQEQRAPDAAGPSSADRPYWYRHRHGRASAAARRP